MHLMRVGLYTLQSNATNTVLFTIHFVAILSHEQCVFVLRSPSSFRFPPAARTLILLGQEWQHGSLLQRDVVLMSALIGEAIRLENKRRAAVGVPN